MAFQIQCRPTDHQDVLGSLLAGSEWIPHDGHRQLNPPKPIGYELALKRDQEARLRFDLEQDGQAKTRYNTISPSPESSVPPNLRAMPPSSAAMKPPGPLTPNHARVQPVQPRDSFSDSNRGIVSDDLQPSRTAKPEEKPVCWDPINSLISSSPGFFTWAEKIAMLTGERTSGARSSQISPAKQDERKTHTARASSVAVPRFAEPPQTRK